MFHMLHEIYQMQDMVSYNILYSYHEFPFFCKKKNVEIGFGTSPISHLNINNNGLWITIFRK